MPLLEENRTVSVLCVFGEHAAAKCFSVINLDAGSAYAVNLHTAIRTAIRFCNDRVLCDIKETARKISCLRGSKRGVSEPLARAVRAHEVLNGIQPLNH